MTVFQAIVLGVVQGLSEFLPISSSAHLALTPWLFGWPDAGLAFDVALHIGTLLAVLWFFQQEWRRLAAAAWRIVMQRGVRTPEERRVVFLVIATIPGAIAGLLLRDIAETTFRNAKAMIAVNLMVMGVLLWVIDRRARSDRPLDAMTWRDALLIGLAQVVALFPGVSRSGATITGGRALGLNREAAAVFSFLMSMPITAAAAVLKVPEVIAERGVDAPFVAGIVASGVSGWLAISVLLKYVSRHDYRVFAAYRFVLGAVILATIYFRG